MGPVSRMAPARLEYPGGIQRLLLKAAREPLFTDLLLADVSAAARYAGVELTDSEAAVLTAIDRDQLEAMLAALPAPDDIPPPTPNEAVNTGGILSDEPPPTVCHGIAPDVPPPVSKGHGADIPGRLWRWLRRK